MQDLKEDNNNKKKKYMVKKIIKYICNITCNYSEDDDSDNCISSRVYVLIITTIGNTFRTGQNRFD